MAAAVVIGILPVACGDDDDGTAEESVDTTMTKEASSASTAPEATPTTPVATAATSSTTAPSVAVGAESTWPWHAPGSAHAEPADAVAEFAEFVGFGQGFLLGEFLQGDSRSGEIEIRPVGVDSLGPPETFSDIPDLLPWSRTTAFVRLDADDQWTVIGAASDGIVVDQPTPEATVSSRLGVELTYKLASDGVWMQVWPDDSAEMLVEKDLHPSNSGIFSQGAGKWSLEVPPGVAGPATAIFQSRNEVSGETDAVTTVRIELTG
jgi:hypothetical protein